MRLLYTTALPLPLTRLRMLRQMLLHLQRLIFQLLLLPLLCLLLLLLLPHFRLKLLPLSCLARGVAEAVEPVADVAHHLPQGVAAPEGQKEGNGRR